ncbi:hypothetical protein HD553DRAFT_339201 [Filobasidium floriforme]|uniref:uncharacterized protein n=1 Tax=Filobasidium floriforme TaxID=5210 RepID=UPI001E8D16B5|nr:uncharacterized protein HD553DRAFT_339201 [Filobasidium floriforme]KAH8089019.1 hypothetical protein HD553DRAFT_339201 [Filobasidium floriforme]
MDEQTPNRPIRSDPPAMAGPSLPPASGPQRSAFSKRNTALGQSASRTGSFNSPLAPRHTPYESPNSQTPTLARRQNVAASDRTRSGTSSMGPLGLGGMVGSQRHTSSLPGATRPPMASQDRYPESQPRSMPNQDRSRGSESPLEHDTPAVRNDRPAASIGQSQRYQGQEAQVQRVNNHQMSDLIKQLQELTATVTQLRAKEVERDEMIKDLRTADAKRQEEYRALEAEVAVLRDGRAGMSRGSSQNAVAGPSEGPGKAIRDAQWKGISKHVRQAVEDLYGTTKFLDPFPSEEAWPMLEASDGTAARPAMRWNLLEASTSSHNLEQTSILINYLRTKRDSIPTTSDFPLDSFPPHDKATDLYADAIAGYQKQLSRSYREKVVKEWAKNGRAELTSQIESAESRVKAGDTEAVAFLVELRGEFAAQEAKYKKLPSGFTNKRRSKLVSMAGWIKNRRLLTEFASPDYDLFESLYWIPPLTGIPDESVPPKYKWQWSDPTGVYSEEWITIFNRLWKFDHASFDDKQRRGPDIDKLEPGQQMQPSKPYLVSSVGLLEQAPQSWMFDETWLAANKDVAAVKIVPTDEFLTKQQVRLTPWYLNHPWVLSNRGQNHGRSGSESGEVSTDTTGTTTDEEGVPTRAPSQADRSRSVTTAEPTAKRVRIEPPATFNALPASQDEREDEPGSSQEHTPRANKTYHRDQFQSAQSSSNSYSQLRQHAYNPGMPIDPSIQSFRPSSQGYAQSQPFSQTQTYLRDPGGSEAMFYGDSRTGRYPEVERPSGQGGMNNPVMSPHQFAPTSPYGQMGYRAETRGEMEDDTFMGSPPRDDF